MPDGYTLDWNVPLRERNTLRVDARARALASLQTPDALPRVLDEPALRDLPMLVLGDGSNVLFAEPRFEGLVLSLCRADVRVLRDEGPSGATVLVDAACGWDALVDWTLGQGLSGLENLALIPGRAGAAPIQNVGAYGVEVGEFIVAVHAYDLARATARRMTAAECGFGYRDSVFKRESGRYVVTAVELQLPRTARTRTGYAGVAEELRAMGVTDPGPRQVAEAVRRLRRRKLPDPAVIGNAGSFFKNPAVSLDTAARLSDRHPGLPQYPAGDPGMRKLSAAWLIEQAGWRGRRDGDAGISAQHALVLVNHGSATGAQLLTLARCVADAVEQRFDIALEPEPRIVGATFRP